jgi:hypothetical protein
MLVGVDLLLALLHVLVEARKDLLVVVAVLLVHANYFSHVLEDKSRVRRRLSEEQVIHVVREESEELVFEHGFFHVFEDFVKSSQVLIHCGFRIENLVAEADGYFELCAHLEVAEDAIELPLGVEEQIHDLVAPVSEDHEQQLIELAVAKPLKSILLILGLHLHALLGEHHQRLSVCLVLDHLLHFRLLDFIFEVLIVFKNFFLELDHLFLDRSQ